MSSVDPSDAELVRRCREGEEAAWNLFVDRFSRYVYAICTRAFRLEEHDAEDAFQDVFTRIYTRLDTLRDDNAVRPWVAQMTRRVCLDRIAAAAREQPVEELEPDSTDPTQDELDEAFSVREALAELGEPCHEMLDRFFARDESYRTIGEELNLPPGTIASRISRCLGKLREQLEGRNRSAAPSGEKR